MIRSFIKAGSWVVISNMSSKVLNFLTLNFLAKMLNPSSFGVFSAFTSSAASINQMSEIGTTMVLQRTGARLKELGHEKAIHRFFIIVMLQCVLNLAFAVFIYVDPELVSRIILNQSTVNESLNLVGIVAVLQIFFQLPMTFLMGLGEFRKYAIRTVVFNASTLLLMIVFLWGIAASLHMAILAVMVSIVLNLALAWIALSRIIRKYHTGLPDKSIGPVIQGILKEGFVYYLGNVLAGAIMNFILISLFSRYIGIEELGYMRIGSALIAIIGIIPTALQPVTITFLAQETFNSQELKSVQLRYVTLVSYFGTVIMLYFLDLIIRLLFGPEYLPGKSIYIYMMVSNIMIVVSAMVTNFLVSKGHTNYIGIVSTIGVVLYTIVAVVAIPRFGIYGFFLGHLVGYGVGFLFVMYREFSAYQYPDIKKLRLLGLLLLLGLAGLWPAFTLADTGYLYLYRVLHLMLMLVLFVSISVYDRDRERLQKLWLLIRGR